MYMRRATRQDLPDIATVASKAMMEDALSLWLSPSQKQYPHIHRERCLRTAFRRWNAGMIMLVMVLEEGDLGWDGNPKIVGYAAYEKEVGAPDDSSKVSATISGAIERFLFNLEHNYIWYFRNNLNTSKVRWHQTMATVGASTLTKNCDRYWELDFLVTDPEFGRRGIGSKFLEWGKNRATEDGVPLLLWATEQGEPLYLRHGFKEVDKLQFPEGPTSPTMRWDPPTAVSTDLK